MRDNRFAEKCADASVVQLKAWFDSGRYDDAKKRVIQHQINLKEDAAREANRAEELAIQDRGATASELQARYARKAFRLSVVALIVAVAALIAPPVATGLCRSQTDSQLAFCSLYTEAR